MKKYIFSHAPTLPCIAVLLCLCPAAMAQDDQNKWQGHVEAEGKWGTERSLGEIGVFLPAWQNNNTLIFGDVRGRFDDQDSSEGNFGLGLRHQINRQWIVGGYTFYDRRRTENNNIFDQATIGIEALSENIEARINGYIPESDEKTVIPATGTSTAGLATGGTFQLVTTTGGGVVERALPGFDAEIGYKFDLPQNWEFWAYGGGFHFSADGYDDVTGPRGRLELSYNDVPYLGEGSKFTVGFETQTDDVRGGQSWALARIRIPLNYNDAKKPSELSALDRRMTARINRDVDIVAASGNGGPSTTTTETAQVTTATGQTVTSYTVLDAADDVDADLPGAGMLVVLDGSSGTLNADNAINLTANQTVVGGGTTFTATGTQSGKTATVTMPGTRATVDRGGAIIENIFNTGGNNSLQDFDMQNAGKGIYINNTDNKISGINIDDTDTFGLHITSNGDRTQVNGVQITQSVYGIFLDDANDVSISDTSITTATEGVSIHGFTTSNLTLDNITIDAATTGVNIDGIGTFDSLSGNVTTTGTATPCQLGGLMVGVTNSTLTVNGVACP